MSTNKDEIDCGEDPEVDNIDALLAMKLPVSISKSDLNYLERLGKGSFGSVHRGILLHNGRRYVIAAKTLLSSDAQVRTSMLREFHNLMLLGQSKFTPAAIGIVSDSERCTYIMELVQGTDLLALVRGTEVTLTAKAQAALGLGKAMEYLKTKGIVHRDLAARNCVITMLGPDFKNIKLVDFGHSRFVGQVGEYDSMQMSPAFAWASIESLERNLWTYASDVWSLAVIFWEIYSDGGYPYASEVLTPQSDVTCELVKEFLSKGGRLETSNFPVVIASLLPACWDYLPQKRPTISDIVATLQVYVETFGVPGQGQE